MGLPPSIQARALSSARSPLNALASTSSARSSSSAATTTATAPSSSLLPDTPFPSSPAQSEPARSSPRKRSSKSKFRPLPFPPVPPSTAPTNSTPSPSSSSTPSSPYSFGYDTQILRQEREEKQRRTPPTSSSSSTSILLAKPKRSTSVATRSAIELSFTTQAGEFFPPRLLSSSPFYRRLNKLLATPREHPLTANSPKDTARSDEIRSLYECLPRPLSSLIPSSTWTHLLQSMVVSPLAASNVNRPSSQHMTGYLNGPWEPTLEKVLEEKISASLEPTEQEYMFILDHFSQNGHVKGTESAFRAMRARGITPSPRAFELRLRAIKQWLLNYHSEEGETLVKNTWIQSFPDAIASVGPLMSEIMSETHAEAFNPPLSSEMIDEALAVLSLTHEWQAFNLLVRYGYGVDLEVPDAIPEEFIARIQKGDELSRGLDVEALESAMRLLTTTKRPAGSSSRRGDRFKGLSAAESLSKALSMLDVFAYEIPTSEDLHPALKRRRSHVPSEVPENIARSSPPPPASTSLSMSGSQSLPSSQPLPSTEPSEVPNAMFLLSGLFSSSSALAPSPQTSTSSPASLPFPRSTLDPNSSLLPIYDLLLRDSTTRHPSIPLTKHILKIALAQHYDRRSSLIGTLCRIVSLPSDALEARQAERATLSGDIMGVRMEWFGWVRDLAFGVKERPAAGGLPTSALTAFDGVDGSPSSPEEQMQAWKESRTFEGEPDQELMVKGNLRERFELCQWAEEEMRVLRMTCELDGKIVDMAKGILEQDDQSERQAMEQERRRSGKLPAYTSLDPLRWPAVSLGQWSNTLNSSLTSFFTHYPSLAFATTKLAFYGFQQLNAVLSSSPAPPSTPFTPLSFDNPFAPTSSPSSSTSASSERDDLADTVLLGGGKTLGERRHEYFELLEERLVEDLAPFVVQEGEEKGGRGWRYDTRVLDEARTFMQRQLREVDASGRFRWEGQESKGEGRE